LRRELGRQLGELTALAIEGNPRRLLRKLVGLGKQDMGRTPGLAQPDGVYSIIDESFPDTGQ